MITKIRGKLVALKDATLHLEVDHLQYEIGIPEFTRRHLQNELNKEVSLHTIDYIEGSPNGSRMIPRLIGFLTEAEREFFELFCSVDGVGVKKALRAMVHDVREVATWIEEQDNKSLATLPGIGPAMAERIVAKLRRKTPKFALLVARKDVGEVLNRDVLTETFEVLCSLGHSEVDSRRLIDDFVQSGKKYKDVQQVLTEIYQKSK